MSLWLCQAHGILSLFKKLPWWNANRADHGTADIDYILREIYVLYADCALKDPFYELEMPIRCELFAQAVDALVDRVEKGTLKQR